MKLWLLRPNDHLVDGDDPWGPWYDKIFGFVIRAETEQMARQLADGSARDENNGEFRGKKTAKTTNPWLDPTYSNCVELLTNGEPGVILEDFASA